MLLTLPLVYCRHKIWMFHHITHWILVTEISINTGNKIATQNIADRAKYEQKNILFCLYSITYKHPKFHIKVSDLNEAYTLCSFLCSILYAEGNKLRLYTLWTSDIGV